MRNNSGMNLLEMLIGLLLITILFFPMIDLLNSGFKAEYKNRLSVEAKEFRETALNRVSSTLKEASYIYEDGSVTIPAGMGSAVVTTGTDAVIALVPAYDDDGNLIVDDGQTLFDAYAYALVSAYYFGETQDYEAKVMVEAHDRFYCDASANYSRVPASMCQTDWTETGITNIIFDSAKPGSFEDDYNAPFTAESNNLIEIIFGQKEGQIYYPSEEGEEEISAKHTQSVNIFCRNVPNS